jgi:hypothetical protein
MSWTCRLCVQLVTAQIAVLVPCCWRKASSDTALRVSGTLHWYTHYCKYLITVAACVLLRTCTLSHVTAQLDTAGEQGLETKAPLADTVGTTAATITAAEASDRKADPACCNEEVRFRVSTPYQASYGKAAASNDKDTATA